MKRQDADDEAVPPGGGGALREAIRTQSMAMKPAHLGSQYASQFQDQSIVRAYRLRPPYPSAVFRILEEIQPQGTKHVLELGCGTGDVTLGLRACADRVDAVEPSAAMIVAARERLGTDDPKVRWIAVTAEEAQFEGPYSLAVAAESLHWMDWSVVLPKIADALTPGAFLALVDRGHRDLPWEDELRGLIVKYSTNREYRPYDLVQELTGRLLFTEAGRCTTDPLPFEQSIADHVESIHSRNGFSRDRMSGESAAEFDTLYRRLLERHCRNGIVRLETVATVIWGVPGGA